MAPKWPKIAFLALAVGWRGDSKNSITVGPRLGNTHGSLRATPIAPTNAIAARHRRNEYAPAPTSPADSRARSRTPPGALSAAMRPHYPRRPPTTRGGCAAVRGADAH